ncbi:MAG: glycosyltransferase family 4 protein [Desulfuromonadaceae bacterium]
MKIAFVGNANNYPLAVARSMRTQGHQVDFFLVNNPSYPLDNPENRYCEYADGYADWIIDLRPLDMWSYSASLEKENRANFNLLISRLQLYDAFVFNQVAVFLSRYVTKPIYLLLTGTDLLTFADLNYSSLRLSLYQNIEDTVERERIKYFYEQRVADQRKAIHTCAGFNFFPIGVVPEGDTLIESIGVTPEKRDSYMVLDTDSIGYAPFKENDIFTITFAARLTWVRDDVSIVTRLDLKGTDIFIKALSILASRGRTVRVHLFRKGAHVEQTKVMAEQLGVADWIIWHDEVTQAELLESFKTMDVVVDNLESPAIGMVALDALATGRPVIARVADMSGFGVIEPPPICSAKSPEEVADWIERLMDDNALKEDYARRGRRFVDTYFSANLAAKRIMDVVQGLNNPYHMQRLEYLHKCPSATKWMYRGLRLYHIIRNRQFNLLRRRLFPIQDCYIKNQPPSPPSLTVKLAAIPYCSPDFETVLPLLPTATKISLPKFSPLKITHYIGTLGSGGAERQLTYVARGQKAAGNEVSVYCMSLESASNRHFMPELEERSILVGTPQPEAAMQVWKMFEDGDLDKRILPYIAPEIREYTLALAGELFKNKPDVLHCWLDTTNCAGAWAGLLAGVPRIVCSFRSANPSNYNETFYHGMAGWMHTAYLVFNQYPAVRFLANAHAVSKDYADWLEISPDQIIVVHNGLDFDRMPQAEHEDLLVLRQELGIPEDVPVIAGVFRLTEEKRPFDFLKIIAKVRESIPNVYVVHAGVGCLEQEFFAEANLLGLGTSLKMLGQRNDTHRIMALSDILLHCAKSEGFSNVVLESSWFYTPPVSTRVGEMECIVEDGISGYLHDVGDINGMTESIRTLLSDSERRQRFAELGHMSIKEKFPLNCLIVNTIELYHQEK